MATSTCAYDHRHTCLLNRHVRRSRNPTLMKVVMKLRFFSDKQIYLFFFFEWIEEKANFARENIYIITSESKKNFFMKQNLLSKFWLRVFVLVAVLTTALARTAWANEVSFSSSRDQGYRSVTKNGITVSMSLMKPSDYPDENGDPDHFDGYRVYKNSDLKITSAVGKITDIEFWYMGDSEAYGFSHLSGEGFSYYLDTGYWHGSADTITLHASEQVRVTTILVTYIPNGNYAVTYDANGGEGTMTDENLYASGSTVTVLNNTFTREGYTFLRWKDADGNEYQEGSTFTITNDVTLYAQWGETTDVLNWATTGSPGSYTYTDWTYTSSNGVEYSGQSSGMYQSIQIRSLYSNSGIVSTTSLGNVRRITVTWNDNTTAGRKLNVYGRNTAYNKPADLYGNNAGTLLGTIVCGTSTSLTVTGDYGFIGLRSDNSAMYIDKILIEWEASDTPLPSLSVRNNEELAYGATSGSFDVTVNNPVDNGVTSVSEDVDWISDATFTGNKVTFTTTVNQSPVAREGIVTLTYTYGTETIIKDVTVTQAGNPDALVNISDITSAGSYAVQGTIVAKSTRGFVVGDGTGYIYYYNQNYAQADYNIGDKVTLVGPVVTYGGVYEFNSSTVITPATTSNYKPERPVILTGADMDARVASTENTQLSTYVQYEGKLTISGSYYNITDINGATKAKGSISYPISTDFTSLAGKVVRVKGYFVGVSSSKYYNTLIGSIKEAVDETETATVGEAGYATYITQHDVAFPEGLAYINNPDRSDSCSRGNAGYPSW